MLGTKQNQMERDNQRSIRLQRAEHKIYAAAAAEAEAEADDDDDDAAIRSKQFSKLSAQPFLVELMASRPNSITMMEQI